LLLLKRLWHTCPSTGDCVAEVILNIDIHGDGAIAIILDRHLTATEWCELGLLGIEIPTAEEVYAICPAWDE
jgi:hypothetical protein